MQKHETIQAITRAGIIVLLLFVYTTLLSAQELVWNTFTEYPPGAKIVRLWQTATQQIAFSTTRVYYRNYQDKKWKSNRIGIDIDQSVIANCFVTVEDSSKVVLWGVVSSGSYNSLRCSSDMGETWSSKKIRDNSPITTIGASFICRDGEIWLFQNKIGNDSMFLYRSVDRGETYSKQQVINRFPDKIVELEDGSVVVHYLESAQGQLYIYKNNAFEEITVGNLEKIRAISAFKNNVVAIADSSIYQWSSTENLWKQLDIEVNIAPTQNGLEPEIWAADNGEIILTLSLIHI